MNNFNGQAHQDKFVLNVLKRKTNGFFLEIGSNDPVHINNSYILESVYNWKGIMIEYDPKFLPRFQMKRPNSIHVIHDATQIDYKTLFESNNVPINIDYLQIDLEVGNGSTIQTLQKLDNEIMNTYKFATVTFEHDIYRSNFLNTRIVSREIFSRHGYVCVFEVTEDNGFPYEDWYVHPDLVDMEYVRSLQSRNASKYPHSTKHGISCISWQDIEY